MFIAKYFLYFFRRNHTNVRNVQNHFRHRVTWRVTCMYIMVFGRSDVIFAVAVLANRPTWKTTCCSIWADAPIRNTSSLSLIFDQMSIYNNFIKRIIGVCIYADNVPLYHQTRNLTRGWLCIDIILLYCDWFRIYSNPKTHLFMM